MAVYDSTSSGGSSGWLVFGGTSASAPIIAAVYALAGHPAAGTYPASYLYASSAGLNDVTSGTNNVWGDCTIAYLCTGVAGYDGPTGLGTPRGTGAFGPTTPGAFAKSGPANAATGQATSLTLSWGASSGASAYAYCYDTSNDNACSGSWIDAGTSTTASLSGLNRGTAYYWQVRATNATATTYANGAATAWWSFTTVPAQHATTTVLAQDLSQTDYGTSVTFSATVTPTTSAPDVPGGTVQLKLDGVALGAPAVLNASGTATWTLTSISPGTHAMSADFLGGSYFDPSGSTVIQHTVQPVGTTDWPQFHNGPLHTGFTGQETTLSAANVSGLKAAWTGATGGPVNSSPAVVNGVVYVGSADGKLYAFAEACAGNGATCTPLWTGTTGAAIDASPVVANGVVYVGSLDGTLYAFAVGCATGGDSCTPTWTGTTGGGIASSPAVADGVVYVGSYDGKLYAFNVGCMSGGASCTPLWTGMTGGVIDAAPAVADGVVYVGSHDQRLYAFAVGCATGGNPCTPLWTAAAGSTQFGSGSSPAVADGVVYIGAWDHSLYAFAVGCAGGGGTCTPLWTGTTGDRIQTAPAVADGVVYTGSADGRLYAFAAGCGSGGSCTPLWTGTTGGPVFSSPAVADGVVYVGSDDGKLYAFAAGCNSGGGTCSPLWTGTTGGSIESSPAVANGVVYVGSNDGKVYAFGLDGPLDHLVLTPNPATIPAGVSQAYTATGYDAHNHNLGDVTSATTFTISPDGSCTGASCSATTMGDHTVTGTSAGKSATATLHVTAGPLDHLVLAPATATIPAGGSRPYTATGYDAYNNSRGDVTAATTFTISPDGSCTGAACTASLPGPHTVTGTSAGRTGTAALGVTDGAPPTGCGKPGVSLSTAVAVGGTVKVHVSWPAGSDAAGPPVTYQLSRSTNGGAWVALALAPATVTSTDVALAPGTSTYRFEVRCLDKAANATPWYVGTSFTLSLLQETSSAIAYGGAWTRAALSGASGGSVRYTGTAARSATFTYTARSFGLVTTRGASRGIARVYVDGVLKATLDLYATSTGAARLVWQTTFTTSASHKIKLVVTGTKNAKSSSARIDLDAFVVLR